MFSRLARGLCTVMATRTVGGYREDRVIDLGAAPGRSGFVATLARLLGCEVIARLAGGG